ncbi:M56 family metallopeptidase [Streptomyces sp. NPDC006925]|uniref:M56 family metallopeptidase n=1 Tax=Streptomyces sp. NPDC006925 TaxID=3364768 RepID=UPI003679A1AE
MTVPLALMVLALFAAGLAPRVLTRSTWPDREPVLALWVWQCVVGAVLLCCLLAMALSGAAAFTAVRSHVFAGAPHGVAEAYSSSASTLWAGALSVLLACGGAWTGAMLLREIRDARARRRRRRAELRERAPRLPGESTSSSERLVILEEEKADAWWLPGANPQLAITTGALGRLKGRQLDAVLEHEQGHARARHDWLLHCSSALAAGFSRVPVFAGFRDQVHRLVELAADDAASRRYGRLTIALALVELNEGRGVFGPCPTPVALVPQRVHRLLAPGPRLSVSRRLRMTAVASLVPVIPVLVAFAPGLSALRH